MYICDSFPTISTFCFRWSLRTGTSVIAWIYSICSVINLFIVGILFVQIKSDVIISILRYNDHILLNIQVNYFRYLFYDLLVYFFGGVFICGYNTIDS